MLVAANRCVYNKNQSVAQPKNSDPCTLLTQTELIKRYSGKEEESLT